MPFSRRVLEAYRRNLGVVDDFVVSVGEILACTVSQSETFHYIIIAEPNFLSHFLCTYVRCLICVLDAIVA
jgi:hypothetical protein